MGHPRLARISTRRSRSNAGPIGRPRCLRTIYAPTASPP